MIQKILKKPVHSTVPVFLFLLKAWADARQNLFGYSPVGQKVGTNLVNICRVFAELSIIRDIRLVQASKIYV